MRDPRWYGKLPETGYVQVLGPVGLRQPGGELVSPPPTGRALLAALVLAGDDGLPAHRLREMLSPREVEGAGLAGLQTTVHRLRHWLRQWVPAGPEVVTLGGGYRVVGMSDLAVFRKLVQQAKDTDELARFELLSRALGIWTGVPLANVAIGRRDEGAVRALERERLVVIGRAAVAAIRIGDPDQAVELLRPVAAADTFDELTHTALIEAFAAAGRPADGRAWYERARRQLAEALGMEPGPRLRAAYRQLDGYRATRPGAGAPCTLPASLADFTGRDAELAMVRRTVDESGVVVISGLPGMGATALAIQAAHGLRASYPAGQLFASGPDAMAQLERQWTVAGRPGPGILLVADGIHDLSTVLAGRPVGAALIVTARKAPPLPIAHVQLTALTPEHARELLSRVCARTWDSEPAALERVLHACGGSPRTLRQTGVLFARRPHWTFDDLVQYLDRTLAPSIESDR